MMKTMQKVLMGAAAAAMVVGLAACGNKAKGDDDKVKIGILQLIDQTALNAVKKGFQEELKAQGYDDKKVTFDFVNAEGDQANLKTMSEQLKNDENAVNLAIATPAAQALQKVANKTPMVFTAVTDPKSAGLVDDVKKPGKNATGVTDAVDVPSQIRFLHALFPKATKVGLLYNASEPNSVFQVKQAKAELEKQGLTVVTKTAASTNDVQQAAESLAAQADAIYIPTDNTIAAAMPTVGKVSLKTNIPVVTADATMVAPAGVATVGINYEDLGKQTAKLAVKILKGEKVTALPVEAPAKSRLVTDEKRMKQFNLTKAQVEAAAEKAK